MRQLLLRVTLLGIGLLCRPIDLHAQVRSAAEIAAERANVLRPGDVVRVRIWREPDLSGDFRVDEMGRVNLPLVGPFSVTGETDESLRQKLAAAYSKSVENLSMDVIFIKRVPIIGAVRSPGLYPIEPTMTAADAVALAGGSVQDLEDTTILLLHGSRSDAETLSPTAIVGQMALAAGDQIYVPRHDTFWSRNPWMIGTLIQSSISVVSLIILSRK